VHDASPDLMDRLVAAQACLGTLTGEASAEGLDTEIHTFIEDGRTDYRICLVRRTYAPAPAGPNLNLVKG
jgi:hypothetical protein